jgi:hypothetical protein
MLRPRASNPSCAFANASGSVFFETYPGECEESVTHSVCSLSSSREIERHESIQSNESIESNLMGKLLGKLCPLLVVFTSSSLHLEKQATTRI